ncbi:MAG: chemotaxis protein CheW [Pseudomonadota bacterium]
MITHSTSLNNTVRTLRQEFDQSFAQPPHTAIAQRESLLAIRMGTAPYAMRVSEIAGLYVDRRIMPLPSPASQLLGVAGFRGQIAPVYDLASLCGYARASGTRWLILLRSQEPVALAFETFEMHFSVTSEEIVSTPGGLPVAGGGPQAHFWDAANSGGVVRPIIQLTSLLHDIQQRAASLIHTKRGYP